MVLKIIINNILGLLNMILTFDIFVLIPSLIVLTSILIALCRMLGKKAIDSISEKLKKREERKQRIKKYKEEIKELEKNPDIPISKINKKKLEFFKEKFYEIRGILIIQSFY